MKIGGINTLSSRRKKTITLWVVYEWEMGFSCSVFSKKPTCDEFGPQDTLENPRNESVNPYFLRGCGIDIPFDAMGKEGKGFYYGDGRRGYHPPIQIKLRLPLPLLEQLNLL